jgi:hypothetical protein
MTTMTEINELPQFSQMSDNFAVVTFFLHKFLNAFFAETHSTLAQCFQVESNQGLSKSTKKIIGGLS